MITEPVTLVEEWAYQRVAADAATAALIPADGGGIRMWPELAPPTEQSTHLTHDLGSPADVAQAMSGPTQWRLLWDVTAWIKGWDRQPLRPILAAALTALVGPKLAGVTERFTAGDGSVWDLTCRYIGPVPAPGDYGATGVWRRVVTRFEILLAPAP